MNHKLRILAFLIMTAILVSCENRSSLITNMSCNGISSGLLSFLWSGSSDKEADETAPDPPVEEIAKKYIIALEHCRFQEAKTYVTEESKATIDFMAQLFEMGGDEAKKAAAEAEVEVKELNCVTKDTISDCSCKIYDGKESRETTMHLVKREGKWLVEQKKESASPEGTEVIEEIAPDPKSDSLITH